MLSLPWPSHSVEPAWAAWPATILAATCHVCAQPALGPTNDGSGLPEGGIPDLVISEINPGDFIEVFNPTDADVDLAAAPFSSYQWCSAVGSSFLYAGLNPKIVIPPNSYAVLDWPANFGNSTDDVGQVALYRSGPFGTPANMLDFTCWGTGGNGGRYGVAVTAGKWGDGADCNQALPADGVLVRNVGVPGTSAADYTEGATPTPETCTIP